MDLAGFESLGALLDQKSADPLLATGPDNRQVGDVAVRDPALRAIEHPVFSVATRPRRHPGRVGAKLRLGQTEAPDHLACRHPWEPVLLLLLRPIAMNREHGQRALHRNEAAQPTVATLEFLAGESINHVAHPRGATAMQVHAEDAELG